MLEWLWPYLPMVVVFLLGACVGFVLGHVLGQAP